VKPLIENTALAKAQSGAEGVAGYLYHQTSYDLPKSRFLFPRSMLMRSGKS
jgi:hypothetical protein